MLEPEGRLLLLDALRPPAGYAFDRAVGTTFTLDLVALLITPVAFALFDVEAQDGGVAANPMAVLESVRRFADRITVFTQAGAIKVPPNFRAAYAYLEKSVVQVKAPRGGIFHPKVWVIRFVALDGDVRFRFLCLSRNLTFDRSWDTVLTLDGHPTSAPTGVSRPIGAFVRSLPRMAIDPLTGDRLDPIEALAAQVETVEWENPPDGLQLLAMWPMGHDASASWPFPESSWRRLAMAPFAEPGFLNRFMSPGRNDVLVSRLETLDGIGSANLGAVGRSYILRDGALVEQEAPDLERDPAPPADGTGELGDAGVPEAVELQGLHAKLFIVDQPYWSHIFTGSANATDAAFNANVEFLVELRGRNTIHGAEALVAAPDGKAIGFGRLLSEYRPSPDPVPPPEDEEAARALDRLAMRIGSLAFRAEVGPPDGDIYPLRLTASGDLRPLAPAAGDTLTITVRPLSRGSGWAVAPIVGADAFAAEWQLRFEALTAFFAIDLRSRRGSVESRTSFVIRAQMSGEPADRLQRLLASEIKNRSDLVRLLLMLLGGTDSAFGGLIDMLTQERLPDRDDARWAVGSEALLEPLMRTLSRNPGRLDEIAHLVKELARTEEGTALLPDGWLGVWAAIEAARPGSAGEGDPQ
jgi:hypothetical protein